MGKFGKHRSGPWYNDEHLRLLFEARAGVQFPTLRRDGRRLSGEPGFGYEVDIEVPFYESRRVQIFFRQQGSGEMPIVLADGPTDSPHRFPDFDRRRLCIWYPYDPRDQRWAFDDGLLTLLGLVKLHLFREAWWRETGEWPGPQAPHAESEDKRGAA